MRLGQLDARLCGNPPPWTAGVGIFYTFLFLKEEGMVYWRNYVDC